MNIIAGQFKGRKLISIDSMGTRPTLARVKESVFCMLDGRFLGAKVLDLFAGSGALGIECLSRGAREVYFCDTCPEAVKVIKKNLREEEKQCKIFNCDYLAALKKLSGNKFDLVFLDPPYATDFGESALKFMLENDMLNDDALVIFEHDVSKSLHSFEKHCIIARSKTYGNKVVDILELKR